MDIDLQYIVISVVYLIPCLIQIYNYKLVNSDDYLRFSAIFFLFAMDNLILSVNAPFFLNALSTLIFSLVNLLALQIAYRASTILRNTVNLKIMEVLYLVIYLISALIEALVSLNRINEDYQSYHRILLNLLSLLSGIFLFFAFFKLEIVIQTTSTKTARILWIIVGVSLIINSFLQIWNEFTVSGHHSVFIPRYEPSLTIIIGIVLIILAVYFPESMIMSNIQFMAITKLYNSTEQFELEWNRKLPSYLGNTKSLEQYLMSLSEYIKNKDS